MKRWVVAGLVAWGLVIAGFAYYSYRNDPATVRDQTTISQALPTVDGALGRIAAALDPAVSVPVLGGYDQLGASCRITAAREGTRYERILMVYTRKNGESELLDRVKAALPASYQATVYHGAATHTLTADAGNYVAVRGGLNAPGQVRFSADTGCRVMNAAVTEPTPAVGPADRAPVQAVLDVLKRSADAWRTHRLTCPSGGTLVTVEAVTGGTDAAFRPTVPPADVLLADPHAFAFRAGGSRLALHPNGDSLVISSVTGCSP